MISRSGTRRSVASSGVTKNLREAGSGPVVTAGSVVSGLERMFMNGPPFQGVVPDGPLCGPIRNLEVIERDSGFDALHRPGMTLVESSSCGRPLRLQPGAHPRIG